MILDTNETLELGRWYLSMLCFGVMFLPIQASTNQLNSAVLAATNALPIFLQFQVAHKAELPAGGELKTSEFAKNAEVKEKPALGIPFQTLSLSLKDVRSYKPGNDVRLLFRPANKQIFPVTSGKRILGGITVEQIGSEWKPSSYSTGGLVYELSAARDEIAPSRSKNAELPFLVQMKSMNYTFLGFHASNGNLLLRPLRPYPLIGLATNTNYSAETVLERLVPIAERYNGLPQ
jgi:hypothetical protein